MPRNSPPVASFTQEAEKTVEMDSGTILFLEKLKAGSSCSQCPCRNDTNELPCSIPCQSYLEYAIDTIKATDHMKQIFDSALAAKEDLENYQEYKKSLANLKDMIRIINFKRKTETNPDKVTEIEQKLKYLVWRYRVTKKKVELINGCLNQLSDFHRAILVESYNKFSQKNWNVYLCEEFGVRKSCLYDNRKKAFKQFETLMYGYNEKIKGGQPYVE